MSESEIFRGCIINSRSSQKDLYAMYYGKMMGVCLRYASSNEDAKEVLHEGFINVFEKLKQLEEEEFNEQWIKKTIILTAIEHIRKNKENLLIVSTVHANKRNEKIVDKVIDDSTPLDIKKEDILKAIQGLTPGYRTAYNLFVMDGFTHQEISTMLDISEETSMLNLDKAKFALRKNLFPYLNPVHE